jgi:medium-chain acyl-[acyl-carrier-protein] hydrolase
MTALASKWLIDRRPVAHAAATLVCFPYAGAGASVYAGWARRVPESVRMLAVQLPGRENRLGEEPLADLDAIVDRLVPDLAPHTDRPYVFFGHSMGALLAFETARRLRDAGRPEPRAIVVSGRRAPHVVSVVPPLRDLATDELIEAVRRFDGTPPAVFDSPELVELFLPALRADFAVAETYAYAPAGGPLSAPMLALSGTEDALCAPAEVEQWRPYTTGGFSHRSYPGGHFFLKEYEAEILQRVLAHLVC